MPTFLSVEVGEGLELFVVVRVGHDNEVCVRELAVGELSARVVAKSSMGQRETCARDKGQAGKAAAIHHHRSPWSSLSVSQSRA